MTKRRFEKISMNRIYSTEAYDILEDFCDDDKGGDSEAGLADIFDRQQVVNLLYSIIKKELRK